MQSRGEAVDLAWMEDVIDQLQRQQPGAETRLLATRLAEIQGRMSPEQALSAHLAIAGEAGERRFTWDGVKDRKRIDSYFDHFGNLTIAQRARPIGSASCRERVCLYVYLSVFALSLHNNISTKLLHNPSRLKTI